MDQKLNIRPGGIEMLRAYFSSDESKAKGITKYLKDMTKEEIDWRVGIGFPSWFAGYESSIRWAASLTKEEWECFQVADRIARMSE